MATLSNGSAYYDFKIVGKKPVGSKYIIETFIYSFKSPKSRARYIAEVEHYGCDLYAIKFYLKNCQDSKDRFYMLTRLNEPRPVINTCIAILLDIYHKDSKASFAFIGSPSPKEIKREEDNPRYLKENRTQRFRIYSTIISTFFSETYFDHRNSSKHSLYLMHNKQSEYTLKSMTEIINLIYVVDVSNM